MKVLETLGCILLTALLFPVGFGVCLFFGLVFWKFIVVSLVILFVLWMWVKRAERRETKQNPVTHIPTPPFVTSQTLTSKTVTTSTASLASPTAGTTPTTMEYKVITASTLGSLESSVNQAIKEGWKPQGGVSADGSYGMVMQAMIR